jgi:hypothetical protein
VRNIAGNKLFASFSALFLALSPWHIYLSRTAYEAPVGLFLVLCGMAVLFSDKNRLHYLSIVFFIASFHSYQGLKLVVPVLLVAMGIYFFWSRLLSKSRLIALLIVFGWIFCYIPLFFVFSEQSARVTEISGVNRSGLEEVTAQFRGESSLPSQLSALLYNKYSFGVWDYLRAFFGFFSVGMLFTGDFFDVAFVLPRHGLMYLVDALFIFIGVVALGKRYKRFSFILAVILIVGMIPAVLSKVGTSYLFRSHISLIGLIVFRVMDFIFSGTAVCRRKLLFAWC